MSQYLHSAHHYSGIYKPTRGNPYRFNVAGQRKKTTLYIALGLFMGLCILFYWLFLSASFSIQAIKINTVTFLPQEEVKKLVTDYLSKARFGIVRQNNLFAFPGKDFAKDLTDRFLLEAAAIRKERPHTLSITFKEIPREAVWSAYNYFYALNSQGLIIKAITPELTGEKPVIYSQGGGVPTLKEQVITPVALDFIARVLKNETIKRLSPQFFIVEKPLSTDLFLKVKEGWKIYFDTKGSLTGQLTNLELTLANSIPPNERPKLSYIDLRFGENVYYK